MAAKHNILTLMHDQMSRIYLKVRQEQKRNKLIENGIFFLPGLTSVKVSESARIFSVHPVVLVRGHRSVGRALDP